MPFGSVYFTDVCPILYSSDILLFFKGGYLDFSHLTELMNIYITEMYMKKQYESSRIKNLKIAFFFLNWDSLKRLRSLLSYF